jgi:hypothetical protein
MRYLVTAALPYANGPCILATYRGRTCRRIFMPVICACAGMRYFLSAVRMSMAWR